MKLNLLILITLLTSGCATVQPHPNDERKEQVRQCIKDMKTSDDNLKEVFEVCRQIYGLKKVKELN